ncbi:hypothetical protein [Pseudobdellovibrio exovorus]|uniref:PorV/PorQ family protein n=1 Tax=Pseudobdellovibrio exovorus JSS TaxID=1184267 RepID=M4V5A1_9BACT|nr:hypothetical protein [Pseudobdellovibrio exovorus]AGH94363.1 hypothetical protein A11Q_143 [Pseudobdellovibrio exovorus JSS]
MRKIILSFICAVSIFSTSTSLAYVGAVSTATGGSGRGAMEPVDGVLLNPAIISDLPKKNLSVHYSDKDWALTVADNGKEAYFPAALVFRRTDMDPLTTQQLGLAFATPRYYGMTFGGTISMYDYTHKITPAQEEQYKVGVLDLGMTLAVTSNFGLGFVAKKVGSGQADLPEAMQVQKTISLGMSYTYQNFARLRFDVESAPDNKTDKLVYMMGLENFLNDWLVFRLGFQNNNVLEKDYFTAGVGFAGPQFGVHYAYISNIKDRTENKHLIDLSIPF